MSFVRASWCQQHALASSLAQFGLAGIVLCAVAHGSSSLSLSHFFSHISNVTLIRRIQVDGSKTLVTLWIVLCMRMHSLWQHVYGINQGGDSASRVESLFVQASSHEHFHILYRQTTKTGIEIAGNGPRGRATEVVRSLY